MSRVIVVRDGLPLPRADGAGCGVAVDVARVLGPLKGRSRSVLEWAGLGGHPPDTAVVVASRHGVTGRAVGQRVARVAAAGVRLPLDPDLEREVSRPSRPGEDHVARERWALLLGRETPPA